MCGDSGADAGKRGEGERGLMLVLKRGRYGRGSGVGAAASERSKTHGGLEMRAERRYHVEHAWPVRDARWMGRSR